MTRYDQRKRCEAEEANAIGTEYARAGLLAAPDAERTRTLLKSYLAERILFFDTRAAARLRQIDAQTAQVQEHLWSTIASAASDKPGALAALAVAGMNDVLNSRSYTQAAFWNRIPWSAWQLMLLIAVVGTATFGYTVRTFRARRVLFILPLVVSLAFFLIADIDSPHGGLIRVAPENLLYLSAGLP